MWEKWRKHLIIICSVVIIIMLMVLTVGSQYHSKIAILADKVFRPIQIVFQGILDIGDNIKQNVIDFSQLQKERDALQIEVALLRKLAIENAELIRENNVLLQALDSKKENLNFSYVFSRVIMRNPSDWYENVIIDVGESSGIKEGMTVISVQDKELGIVGIVEDVYENTSKIHLLVDPGKNIAVAAQVMNAPLENIDPTPRETAEDVPLEENDSVIWYQGIVEGSTHTQGMLEMIYITHEASIQVGSPVLSTGLGGYYIDDIPIGTVEKLEVDAFGLLKRALIRPYIDVSRLREVLIITSPLPLKMEGLQ